MGAGAGTGTTDGFGRLLRGYRTAAGLTQEELAARAGLSVRAVSDMERGRTARPFARSVRLLADALELPVSCRARLIGAAQPGPGDAGRPGPPDAGGEPATRPVVPRQLPAGVEHFAGRAAELAALDELVAKASGGTAGTLVISAIGGTAGVGKTALAVHFGHRAAGAFPDGQLYVNLRGFGPAGEPMHPGEALRGFLDALGVQPGQIPASVEARAALFRSLLTGQRTLVFLDNAADEQQVRPLLPGSPGCMAVVTSRRQLTGLAAAEEARLLTLDVLADGEARELLAARIGSGRVAAEPVALAELTRLCAGLPLALAITAARAAARPTFPLADFAAELRETGAGLGALDTGDPVASVRAVFSWSYRALSGAAARMFRLLGLHLGPDISLPAAASLAGISRHEARALLNELTRSHLLTGHLPGRYALHDLLLAYAGEQASGTDSPEERHAATQRMLDHYLHSALAADRLLYPARDQIAVAAPDPLVIPEVLDGHHAAMTWFDVERSVLLSATAQAAANHFDASAWQIPWAMATYFARRGYWDDWAAIQRTALTAAQCSGDLAAQAHSHRYLGRACIRLGQHGEAFTHLWHVLELYRQLGDLAGQALTRIDIAQACEAHGEYRLALDHAYQALSLYQTAGHRIGQARALNTIGWDHAHLGNYQQAVACCRQALNLHRELSDRFGEATAWDSLGYAHRHLGQHGQAAACYQRACALHTELDDRYHQADTLRHLGETHRAAGHAEEAREAWRAALAILDELNHPDAKQVRARLSQLEGAALRVDEADAANPAW